MWTANIGAASIANFLPLMSKPFLSSVNSTVKSDGLGLQLLQFGTSKFSINGVALA